MRNATNKKSPRNRLALPVWEQPHVKLFKSFVDEGKVGFFDPKFLKTVQDMFLHINPGAAIELAYEHNSWDKSFLDQSADTDVTTVPEFNDAAAGYYPFYSEVKLLDNLSGYFSDVVAKNLRKRGDDIVYLGLGDGTRIPILQKTAKVIRAIKPRFYSAKDIVHESAYESAMTVQQTFPEITVSIDVKDFNKDRLTIPADGPRFMGEFGIPLGNLPGSPDHLPSRAFKAALQNYRKQLNVGDYLALTLDHNHDAESLNIAYGSPMNAMLCNGVLQRAEERLPGTFKAAYFKHMTEWTPHKHLYRQGFVAQERISFELGDKVITYRRGEITTFGNFWKYPIPFAERLFREAGFKQEERFPDENNRISLYSLRAA